MATYRFTDINHKLPQITDAGYYGDIRFDHSDDTPTYIGLHLTKGVSTDDGSWKIYKFTYTGTNVNHIELAYGSWDARATLF